jgi:hypothetical protein
MPNTQEENQIPIGTNPDVNQIYAKCLTCPDYGTTCRGFDLVSLGGINAVRAFHKAVKKAHNISPKAIAAEAKEISDYTISEYFSPGERDYKWTTVVTIDKALLSISGNRVGLPPLEHACPISSSEARQQLAAADLNLAAANMDLANMRAECDDLRRRLEDSDGSHISQLAELQAAKQDEVDWLKNDIKLWRRFAFMLLGIGIILLACLVFYIAWDIAHPASGLIRY